MTLKPSIIPVMAMRTISLENVRFERKEMREAMNEAKFKRQKFYFCTLAKMQN